MGTLNLTPSIAHADDLYASLIGLHDGLSDEQSAIINARLIMILINHIGDEGVIRQAIDLARASRFGTD